MGSKEFAKFSYKRLFKGNSSLLMSNESCSLSMPCQNYVKTRKDKLLLYNAMSTAIVYGRHVTFLLNGQVPLIDIIRRSSVTSKSIYFIGL